MMKKKTLLFQGDEITTANYNNILSGYVDYIKEKLYDYTVLNMAEDDIDTFVMYSRWDERGMDYSPEIFTVMTGKNDILTSSELPPGETARRYIVLLDAAIKEARRIKPGINLIFIEPFMIVNDEVTKNEKIMKNEMTLLQKKLEELAKKYNFSYIKTQEYFDLHKEMITENFYPDENGQKFVADKWLECFENLA